MENLKNIFLYNFVLYKIYNAKDLKKAKCSRVIRRHIHFTSFVLFYDHRLKVIILLDHTRRHPLQTLIFLRRHFLNHKQEISILYCAAIYTLQYIKQTKFGKKKLKNSINF